VRFLIDSCVPRLVTVHLREAGHDVVETRERGPDPGDAEIMAWAADERRILVTADGDHAVLALRHGLAHHGIVQLAQRSVPELIATLESVMAAHSEDDLASTVVIARRKRLRFFRVVSGGKGET
jgi:predicted nuclease of predicted toxin-antitoxin system